MRFKCVKEYDIAKPGEVWEMNNYKNLKMLGTKDFVMMVRHTNKSTVNLMVYVLDFDKHFEYVDIGMAGGEQCDT